MCMFPEALATQLLQKDYLCKRSVNHRLSSHAVAIGGSMIPHIILWNGAERRWRIGIKIATGAMFEANMMCAKVTAAAASVLSHVQAVRIFIFIVRKCKAKTQCSQEILIEGDIKCCCNNTIRNFLSTIYWSEASTHVVVDENLSRCWVGWDVAAAELSQPSICQASCWWHLGPCY